MEGADSSVVEKLVGGGDFRQRVRNREAAGVEGEVVVVVIVVGEDEGGSGRTGGGAGVMEVVAEGIAEKART